MTWLTEMISFPQLVAALGIGFLAGTVKGITGFAMPMIMISGLSSFLSPELALAALILPTLVTNTWQALRQGFLAALGSLRAYAVFLFSGGICLVLSAGLFASLPISALLLMIGLPVSFFAVYLLLSPKLRIARSRPVEALIGAFAGFVGGVSGVWGPPTVAYLAAIDTPKDESLRVQGVIYALGSVLLALAHLRSGVLNSSTVGFSVLMILPAGLGMACGLWLQGRLDQQRFRLLTLLVLLVAGLNLIRRGLWG